MSFISPPAPALGEPFFTQDAHPQTIEANAIAQAFAAHTAFQFEADFFIGLQRAFIIGMQTKRYAAQVKFKEGILNSQTHRLCSHNPCPNNRARQLKCPASIGVSP